MSTVRNDYSSSSATSAISDDNGDDKDDVPRHRRKRYKLPLNPDYDPSQVCKRTHSKWTASQNSLTSLPITVQDRLQTSSSFGKRS